ncbi:MAG: ABC transporter permease [Chloroflexi bacterium]|nr:ABC transporter permease [Chloroflexota bacterium]MBP8055614.1 ABC transporter permease [Chloroflexota bacterium]
MLTKIIHLATFYITNTYRERAVFIFNLLMPLVFTFVLSQANQGPIEIDGPSRWPLQLVNEDEGELGADLFNRLEESDLLEVAAANQADALQALRDEETVAVLLIPADFSAQVLAGQAVTLEYHVNQVANEAQIVQAVIDSALTEMSGSVAAAEFTLAVADELGRFAGDAAAEDSYYQTAFQSAQQQWQNNRPVIVQTASLTRLEVHENAIAVGINQSAPGMMVMFAMFFTLGGVAVLVVEREQGTLRRLLVLPLTKFTILFGKLLGIYIAGIVQIAILVLVGAFAFGADWGREPVGLTILILCYSFAITSLGMLMAALVRTSAQANTLSTVIILPMAALGGAWWPLDIVPPWMQTFGHLFPTAWAMDGFTDLITRGLGTQDILLEAGVLLLYGVVFMVIGVWRFRYE